MAERNPFARESERGSGPTMGGTGSPGTGRGPQSSGEFAGKAQDKAGELQERVKQQAVSGLSSQKSVAADSLHSIAEALRTTERQLRTQDQGTIAEYANNAASQVDRFSNYLRESDLGDMVGEVERLARRQPAVFLGGAFFLGLLGARFLRTSAPQQRYVPTTTPNYGTPTTGSTLSGLGTVSAGERATEPEGPARGTVVPWPRTDEPAGDTGSEKGPSGGTEG